MRDGNLKSDKVQRESRTLVVEEEINMWWAHFGIPVSITPPTQVERSLVTDFSRHICNMIGVVVEESMKLLDNG